MRKGKFYLRNVIYARGMTTRDIQAQLQELYGVEVSPTFISNVTEQVMGEVQECAEAASGGALSHPVGGLPGGCSSFFILGITNERSDYPTQE